MRTTHFAALAAFTCWLGTSGAAAQGSADRPEGVVACASQQALEQYLQSDRKLFPEACRTVAVTEVRSQAGTLCVLDMGEDDPGLIESLAQAAAPTKWWVACEGLPPGFATGQSTR